MDQSVKNIISDLLTPIILIILAVFLRPYLPDLTIIQASGFVYLPFILLSISLILSWKFNQIESFYVTLMLAIAYAGVLETNPETSLIALFHLGGYNTGHFIPAIALLLPLNFILFQLIPASRVLSLSGTFRLILLSAESYFVYWTALTPPSISSSTSVSVSHSTSAINSIDIIDVISFQIWPDAVAMLANIPQIAILLFAIALLIQLGFVAIRQSPIDSTMLGVLVIAFIASVLEKEPLIFFTTFSAAAIMLTIAAIQTLHNMAFIDTLTQLPSRRAMENEIKKLGKRYCIAMLDIDHFKKLNDTYGHDVGDQVLRMVAKHIRRVGGGGRPARYGGEEFIIIFPSKTLIDAQPWLEIVRGNIENAKFSLRSKKRPKNLPKTRQEKKPKANEVSVTISIGIAERIRNRKAPNDVMKAADEALYKAKRLGRNRLCH